MGANAGKKLWSLNTGAVTALSVVVFLQETLASCRASRQGRDKSFRQQEREWVALVQGRERRLKPIHRAVFVLSSFGVTPSGGVFLRCRGLF